MGNVGRRGYMVVGVFRSRSAPSCRSSATVRLGVSGFNCRNAIVDGSVGMA